jgi:hypothetical protein
MRRCRIARQMKRACPTPSPWPATSPFLFELSRYPAGFARRSETNHNHWPATEARFAEICGARDRPIGAKERRAYSLCSWRENTTPPRPCFGILPAERAQRRRSPAYEGSKEATRPLPVPQSSSRSRRYSGALASVRRTRPNPSGLGSEPPILQKLHTGSLPRIARSRAQPRQPLL